MRISKKGSRSKRSGVDIITEFVDRFEENKNNRYLIYHEIAKDAIIVYE